MQASCKSDVPSAKILCSPFGLYAQPVPVDSGTQRVPARLSPVSRALPATISPIVLSSLSPILLIYQKPELT